MSPTLASGILPDVTLPGDVRAMLEACASVTMPQTREELYALALGPTGGPVFDVVYDVDGAPVKEVDVVR